jgi:hypothetical protein
MLNLGSEVEQIIWRKITARSAGIDMMDGLLAGVSLKTLLAD